METKVRTTSDHIRDQKLEEALEPSPVAVARGGEAESETNDEGG